MCFVVCADPSSAPTVETGELAQPATSIRVAPMHAAQAGRVHQLILVVPLVMLRKPRMRFSEAPTCS